MRIPKRIGVVGLLLLYGCGSAQDSSEFGGGAAESRPNAASSSNEARRDRVVGLVDGRAVRMSDLEPTLLELAGAEALGEVVLDRRLQQEAADRGLAISPADIERERELLRRTLSDDPDEAVRLLERLRTRRGLGETRFPALLRRNALLRAMVRDRVELNEASLRATFDMLHGEKYQPRLIVVDRLAEAEAIFDRLDNGAAFADLAVAYSTDASAGRGGLLEPISPADPSYPKAIRDALKPMTPGDVSRPVMIDGGFAILRLERIVPPNGTRYDDVRARLVELTRRNQERILMEELARRLISEARITITDDTLEEAWEAPRR